MWCLASSYTKQAYEMRICVTVQDIRTKSAQVDGRAGLGFNIGPEFVIPPDKFYWPPNPSALEDKMSLPDARWPVQPW